MNKETPAIIFLVLAALGLLIATTTLVVRGNNEYQKFQGTCEYLGGKVYYVDQDHKVCIKNGKVVLR